MLLVIVMPAGSDIGHRENIIQHCIPSIISHILHCKCRKKVNKFTN